MTVRTGRPWPNGGIPPIVNPVSSCASRAVARRMSCSPVTAARRARSTRFGPQTRQRIGSSAPSSPGATNTSDLTIWPSSASTVRGGVLGGVGRLVEHPDRRGRRPSARRRRGRAGSPDGRAARARPESTASVRSRPQAGTRDPRHGDQPPDRRRSIGPMEAILFDWDGTLVDSLGAFHARQRDRDGRRSACPSTSCAIAGTTSPTGARCTGGWASRTTGSTRRTRSGRRPSPPTATASLAFPGAAGGARAAARRRRDARDRDRRPSRGRRAAAGADRARPPPAGPGVRRRPAGPQAGPGAAPAGAPAGRSTAIGRRRRSTSATPRPTCRWRSPSAPARSGSSRSSATPTSSGRPGPRRWRRRSPPGRRHISRRASRGTAPPRPSSAGRVRDEQSPRPRPRRRHGRAGAATSTRPGRAGRTGSTSSSPPTAAPATRPRSAGGSTCGSATAIRSRRRTSSGWPRTASGSTGRRSTRTRPTPSSPCSPRSRPMPRRITILGALGGTRLDHGLGNVWLLAHPALAGREVRLLGAGSRIRLAGPGRTDLGGRDRRPRLAPAVRRRRRRAHDRRASATRSATSPSGAGRRAACRTCARPRTPRLTAPDRPAPRRGDPC